LLEDDVLKHDSPVWFITGCSTGLGSALAQVVIKHGWRVVATTREKSRLSRLASEGGDRAIVLDLDVTDRAEIEAAVSTARERFGRIDVLVNNAGYGYQATVEEGEDREIRAQFEVNVFGLFAEQRTQPTKPIAPPSDRAVARLRHRDGGIRHWGFAVRRRGRPHP
jgi:NAD(P)-dependent dehydrogenase (short-subunit alcohol dehydrogenase family)